MSFEKARDLHVKKMTEKKAQLDANEMFEALGFTALSKLAYEKDGVVVKFENDLSYQIKNKEHIVSHELHLAIDKKLEEIAWENIWEQANNLDIWQFACPSCGEPVETSLDICPHCGEEV